ncbi:shikimate kinase [Marinicrinis lubricantis]|uniref:Shikimate kinase n=1 Tax=Marinicrinis lubricantis TaxID=2086470 RepID=A0ABW1IQG9_9BACL
MNKSNIVLVGFMGTGKTTIGIELAKHLGWQFVDTDAFIVDEAGMTIPEIFARHGQSFFRDVEERVVQRVMNGSDQVISTGGGSVLRESNREMMLRGGMVVALSASEETIVQRVSKDTNRPLLADNPLENIRRLMKERKDAYQFAHISIQTDELTVTDVVEHILAKYKAWQEDAHSS